MATNFLKFFSIGSDGVAFMVGASGVGKMYTWSVEGATSSGLFWGWAVALGIKFMGIG